MSPEQASLNNLDIDTRSDVYALGVLLYELLTGSTPVDKKSLKQAALMEVLRIVREVEAPRPSTKLSSSEALPSIAANRHTEPARLSRLVKGELDWIVMKALEKDRSRRYETANGFAADVLRYLSGEPVLAHPPSTVYRLRMFVRKHRGPVMAAGVVALALVLGIIGTTWGLFEANRAAAEERLAKQEADRKRQEAEEQTALALATKNFLQRDVLRLADPGTQQQQQLDGLKYYADLKLRDVVIRAAQGIDGKFPNQPLVEAEIRSTLGFTLRGMGRADLALPQDQQARTLYAQKFGADHPETLRSMQCIGICYALLGRHEEARKLFDETLTLRKQQLGQDHPDTLSSMNNLANSYTALGRYEEMMQLRNQTVSLVTEKLGPYHPDTFRYRANLATSYEAIGKDDEALKLREELLSQEKEKLGSDHPETLRGMNNLAISYDTLGRRAEALKLHEETLALQKEKLGPNHPDTLSGMHNLGNSYEKAGRQADALKLRFETLQLRKQILGADHPATLASMNNLAFSYDALNRPADALKLREETLMLQKQKLGIDHPETLGSMQSLASSYSAANRIAESLKLLEEKHTLEKLKLGPDHPDTLFTLRSIIRLLWQVHREKEAAPLIDEALVQAAKAKAGDTRTDTSLIPQMLAYRYSLLHREEDVTKCLAAVEQNEKRPLSRAEDYFRLAQQRSLLACMVQARPDEAKSQADRAMAWLQKAVAAGYRNRQKIEKEIDFEPLRRRDDFKKLLDSLRQPVEKK